MASEVRLCIACNNSDGMIVEDAPGSPQARYPNWHIMRCPHCPERWHVCLKHLMCWTIDKHSKVRQHFSLPSHASSVQDTSTPTSTTGVTVPNAHLTVPQKDTNLPIEAVKRKVCNLHPTLDTSAHTPINKVQKAATSMPLCTTQISTLSTDMKH